MIEKKLLISYLKKQKREYNEQAVILQKELTSPLVYNHKQEYIIKNIMYKFRMNVIRIYEDLIEKIENGEFNVQMAHSLSADTIPVDYGFHQAEKSVQSLNELISSIPEGKYNEDFINEMKRIHTLINLTRVLNKLIELIENGEFDVIENPKKRRNNQMIRKCIHCKKSRGLSSDVWCSEGHPYESYMRETDCPYFEPYDDDY